VHESLDPAALLAVARRAADAAADTHRVGRGRIDPSAWGEKGRSDFVTEVDVEAERRIVEIIHAEFPEHVILAEEGTGAGERGGSIRWIIDPLDGTTNWLHGYPEYAVSLAAEDETGLLAALVLNSATGERFEAVRGGGATLDGDPIEVSRVSELKHALVGTGFPFKKTEVLPAYLATFERVLRRTSGIRRAGAAALDLCDLACGRLDAFFEYWLMPWDVAAGALIVREAGGAFERLEVPGLETGGNGGKPKRGNAGSGLSPGGFLAANTALAGRFRSLVEGGT
jgi:myo-inositol-1(or 4)-monophosphatase